DGCLITTSRTCFHSCQGGESCASETVLRCEIRFEREGLCHVAAWRAVFVAVNTRCALDPQPALLGGCGRYAGRTALRGLGRLRAPGADHLAGGPAVFQPRPLLSVRLQPR